MRTLERNVLAAVAAALVATASAAAEELTIVAKKTREGAPPVTTTSYIGSDRMRASQGDTEFMAVYGSAEFTVIHHKKKEYSVITKQDLEAMAAQMQAQMKQMEQQMANMPPQAREQMQKMMGGIAQAINVQKGTGGRTIAGYACRNWVITFGEMVKTESCVSTDLQYPPAAYEGFKNFSSAMAGAAGPMGKGMSEMFDKFKEMKGLPLASTTTVSVMGKAMVSTDEVTEIKKGAIPASAWEMPAGYKKVDAGLKVPRK